MFQGEEDDGICYSCVPCDCNVTLITSIELKGWHYIVPFDTMGIVWVPLVWVLKAQNAPSWGRKGHYIVAMLDIHIRSYRKFGFMHVSRIIWSVLCVCENRQSHSSIKNYLLMVHIPVMRWCFPVLIAHSYAFMRWKYGGTFWKTIPSLVKNSHIV